MSQALTENFDVLSRATWIASALAAQANLDMSSTLAALDRELSDTVPAPDQATWLAMEKVCQSSGLRAVKFTQPGQSVAGVSLAWVDPDLPPDREDAARLARIPLVVASPAWQDLIKQVAPGQARRPRP